MQDIFKRKGKNEKRKTKKEKCSHYTYISEKLYFAAACWVPFNRAEAPEVNCFHQRECFLFNANYSIREEIIYVLHSGH